MTNRGECKMSQDDVAALVERLEKCHEYIEKNAADESVDPDDVRQWGTIYSEAASAIKAQAAEIVELQKKVWTLEADAEASLDIANQCRADAEAAEAKLREARADGMREAARIAYGAPHYVSGMDPDEFGVMPPPSPNDRGRHDAMKAILSAIGESTNEQG